MIKQESVYFMCCLMLSGYVLSSCTLGGKKQQDNQRVRVLISTDIGGTDPDDNQSMAHFLMYCNEFDVEGLVSSPSYGCGSREEILRMIDLYEQDLLQLRKHDKGWLDPDYLRFITKQGRKGAVPYCGYSTATEGSEWIVKCARRVDERPLWVLVWGGLDDLAQALHDAPDIADKIHVYWIGGPNKKWSTNSYAYIVEHFPNLWFIENNSSYRGFIGKKNVEDEFNASYYDTYIKGGGKLGDDFVNYLEGHCKLGDTPSLLYLMDGDPSDPMCDSWGGSFVPLVHSSCVIIDRPTTATDTVPIYSIMEFRINGPKVDLPADSVCFTLTIGKQKWGGYYLGNGMYVVRHSTYYTGTLPYTIISDIPDFPIWNGEITVDNMWPGTFCSTDYLLGDTWYTDKPDLSLFENGVQGARTVSYWRNVVMADWGKRWSWLKE
ncbi:nucleoside hydrolase-like domain-containing protein [Parabacteroides johnsonii]|uniref:nucleoside hydrolase-like domain-containing protein n=1 Tax=Parabacteroides johnsonii TaxID=387661 RepID=UPI003967159D